MSLIDFTQDAQDQGCMHIVVAALSDKEARTPFDKDVLDCLCKLPPIQLAEPKGTVLFLRFLDAQNLPKWASDGPKWDEFSAHKQVLGVLVVCQCLDTDDLDNAKAGFGKACAKFKSTFCDTNKCIIYGPKKHLEQYVDPRKGYCLIDCNLDQEQCTVCREDLEEIVTDFALSIYVTLKSKIGQIEKGMTNRLEQLKALKSPCEQREPGSHEDDQSSGEAR